MTPINQRWRWHTKNKLSTLDANLFSFYLTTDDALHRWEDNNTFFKPQTFYQANGGDHTYKYFPGNPSGEKLFLTFFFSQNRILQRLEESLAYAAKSSTKAMGAESNAHGSYQAPLI